MFGLLSLPPPRCRFSDVKLKVHESKVLLKIGRKQWRHEKSPNEEIPNEKSPEHQKKVLNRYLVDCARRAKRTYLWSDWLG